MAYIRDGMAAFVQDKISDRARSSFASVLPILDWFGLTGADPKNVRDYLGRPKTGAVFGGGAGFTEAERMMTLGSFNHQFPFVKAEPSASDVATVGYGEATPTPTEEAERNFGTAETRWTRFVGAVKVSKDALEAAQSDYEIMNVLAMAVLPTWDLFAKRIAQSFWTGTRTQAQQDDLTWKDLLGIVHTTTTNNYYGRVNRATHTNLNPLVLAAATQLPSPVIDLDVYRKVNYGFIDALGATQTGLANKDPLGVGCDLWVTTPDLFNELESQADGRYTIYKTGIPERGIGAGNMRPVIDAGNVKFTYDPMCPAGTMVGLNMANWVVEIAPGFNFNFIGWTDQSKTELGGSWIEWGDFVLKVRLSCRAPDLQCRITGLTTA